LFSIEAKEKELISKYPDLAGKIKKALDINVDLKKPDYQMSIEEVHAKKSLEQKKTTKKVLEEKKVEKVRNMSYEE
jgi:tRNA(Ser,Leu) C12 N-acetylase TAN1